jgi:hypothetical protein
MSSLAHVRGFWCFTIRNSKDPELQQFSNLFIIQILAVSDRPQGKFLISRKEDAYLDGPQAFAFCPLSFCVSAKNFDFTHRVRLCRFVRCELRCEPISVHISQWMSRKNADSRQEGCR